MNPKIRNPLWMKLLGVNWLYRRFGIVICTYKHTDVKWGLAIYRIREEK